MDKLDGARRNVTLAGHTRVIGESREGARVVTPRRPHRQPASHFDTLSTRMVR